MLQPTYIASGTHIEGTLKVQNELHLYGSMEGHIISSETVTIEHGALFRGTICAPTLLIKGSLHAEVDCDLVKMMSGGSLHGTITSFMLIIEPKAQFEGHRILRSKKEDGNASEHKSTELDTENILL